jgi:hypothetical protein
MEHRPAQPASITEIPTAGAIFPTVTAPVHGLPCLSPTAMHSLGWLESAKPAKHSHACQQVYHSTGALQTETPKSMRSSSIGQSLCIRPCLLYSTGGSRSAGAIPPSSTSLVYHLCRADQLPASLVWPLVLPSSHSTRQPSCQLRYALQSTEHSIIRSPSS